MSSSPPSAAAADQRPVLLFYTANNKSWPHFPESVLSLAGSLRAAGWRPVIIDTELQQIELATLEQPLFVGISTFSNEGISIGLKIARQMRKLFPGKPIIWGGPHVHMMPNQTAAHELVDAACYGEGEETITALARVIAGGGGFSEVPGLVYRERGKISRTPLATIADPDQLPPTPYDLLQLDLYPLAGAKFYYQTSRGCPFTCRFCSYTYQERWRGKSASRVVADVKEIVRRFEPEEIYVGDGNFFVSLKRVREICEAFIEERFTFRWTSFCRFDTFDRMDDQLLALLRRSGCFSLNFGGESGSDEMLRYLNKKISRAQIIAGLKRATQHGLGAEVSFMCGVPAETDSQRGETLALIDEIAERFPEVRINGLFHYQAYPNTPLMEEIMAEYDLPLPKDLVEWGERPVTSLRREYFPWLDDRRYSEMRTLTAIASYRYYYGKLMALPQAQRAQTRLAHPLLLAAARAADIVVRPLIDLRWRVGVFDFPVEWRIWEMMRDRLLGQI